MGPTTRINSATIDPVTGAILCPSCRVEMGCTHNESGVARVWCDRCGNYLVLSDMFASDDT